MSAGRSPVTLTAPTHRRFVDLHEDEWFSCRQAFVKHLLEEENRLQLELKIARFPTPLYWRVCPQRWRKDSPSAVPNESAQSPSRLR